MIRRLSLLACAIVACAPAQAPGGPASGGARDLQLLPIAATEWGSGPEAAVKVAHVYGDPARPGLFVQRMQMPPGVKTQPHWHDQDELITVLSGSIYMGKGDTFDEAAAKEIGPGGLVVIPARMHHFGGTKGGAVLQVQGIGPFEMNWLTPEPIPAGGW